jgi:hypothetical protein
MALTASLESNPVSNLQLEYNRQLDLYSAQISATRQFLDVQARQIAISLQENLRQVHFLLPESVRPAADNGPQSVPAGQRNQSASGRSLLTAVLNRLVQLERSADQGLAISASLLRFSIAHTILHQLLPDGRPVYYRAETGDDIPSQPIEMAHSTSGLVEDLDATQVPFTAHALRFFLPQWVAFDEQDRLLTTNLLEAEACLRSMQATMSLLGQAVSLDPYIVVDETYQRKRSGMLGQLVNQGRALGRHTARQIVIGIQQRASQSSLNRGLSLDIDYFDDQRLVVASYYMKVIPFGRVMFLPSFVVLAARREASKITSDPLLNPSTRRHLLSLMAIFEQAFLPKEERNQP